MGCAEVYTRPPPPGKLPAPTSPQQDAPRLLQLAKWVARSQPEDELSPSVIKEAIEGQVIIGCQSLTFQDPYIWDVA